MKKPEILFIHGGGEGAYDEDKKIVLNLKNAVGNLYNINYPEMPNENDPNYEAYKNKIEEEIRKTDGKLILVGHSLGSCFLLKYLSETKIDKEINGIFLIATPFWGPGGWLYEGFSLDSEFESKLPANVPIFFYHSTDDEIVPFSHLALYAKKLPHAAIRKIDGGGHQINNDVSEVVRDIKSLGYPSMPG